MADLWISDFGLRVTDFEKSIEFYTKPFDLEEFQRGDDEENKYVLFRDRRSGQRLELNGYAETGPLWAPYVPDEGLGHVEVRVKSIPEILDRLRSRDIRSRTFRTRTGISSHCRIIPRRTGRGRSRTTPESRERPAVP